jgi:hypothetical protein
MALPLLALARPSMPMIVQFGQGPVLTEAGVSTNKATGKSCLSVRRLQRSKYRSPTAELANDAVVRNRRVEIGSEKD